MMRPMAVVFACPFSVASYVARAEGWAPERPSCPTCGGELSKDGTYPRWLRHRGARLRLRIQRGRCRRCGTSQALLPDFVVANHLDSIESIAAALEGHASAVPAPTVAGWRRRLGANHAALVAGLRAGALAWGDDRAAWAEPELSVLVRRLWRAAAMRVGPGRLPGPWPLLNVVSGSSWMATRVKSSWTGVGPMPVPVRGP